MEEDRRKLQRCHDELRGGLARDIIASILEDDEDDETDWEPDLASPSVLFRALVLDEGVAVEEAQEVYEATRSVVGEESY